MDRFVLVFAMVFGLNLVDLNATLPKRPEKYFEQYLDGNVKERYEKCLCAILDESFWAIYRASSTDVDEAFKSMVEGHYIKLKPKLTSGSLSDPEWRAMGMSLMSDLRGLEQRITCADQLSVGHRGLLSEMCKLACVFLYDEVRLSMGTSAERYFRDKNDLVRFCDALRLLCNVDYRKLIRDSGCDCQLLVVDTLLVREVLRLYNPRTQRLLGKCDTMCSGTEAAQDARDAVVRLLVAHSKIYSGTLSGETYNFYAPIVLLALKLLRETIRLQIDTQNSNFLPSNLRRIAKLLENAVDDRRPMSHDEELNVFRLLKLLNKNWCPLNQEILDYVVGAATHILDGDYNGSSIEVFMGLTIQLHSVLLKGKNIQQDIFVLFVDTVRDFFRVFAVSDAYLEQCGFLWKSDYDAFLTEIDIQAELQTILDTSDARTMNAEVMRIIGKLQTQIAAARRREADSGFRFLRNHWCSMYLSSSADQ